MRMSNVEHNYDRLFNHSYCIILWELRLKIILKSKRLVKSQLQFTFLSARYKLKRSV